MSWLPDNDPVLGDIKSCDALELVIVPRTRDLGDGFEVRRALPHGKRQMVGPFIFFDHSGRCSSCPAGHGRAPASALSVLATVTYLFNGSIMHREQRGQYPGNPAGAMNLMTAGRGIAHSERTPDVAAPRRPEDAWACRAGSPCRPAPRKSRRRSSTTAAAELPTVTDRGFTARIIAGGSFGVKSPVTMVSPWFYTEVTAQQGISVPLDPDHEEARHLPDRWRD